MKKLLIVFAILLFGLNSTKAQDVKGIIKVNPIGFAFGIFNATYEMPLSEKNSLTIGASFFNWSNLGISGIGADAGYRFYFSKTNSAPEGLFVGPELSVGSYSYDFKKYNTEGNLSTEKQSTFAFGGGLKGGYQWVWDSGIALDLYVGYGYRAAKFNDYNYSGGYPILGLAIGYAF